MKTIVIAMLGLLVMLSRGQSQPSDGADLTAYLNEIRASGISEMGRSHLYSVAAICAGSSILEYRLDKAGGRYWPSYTMATCPKPGADPPEIEKWKQFKRSETDVLVDKLKPFADADESGFVTTKEAGDFRGLLEYGYLVAQVIRDEGANMEFVVRASGKNLEEATQQLEEYKVMARKITEVGVPNLPDLKVANAGPPFE